MTNYHPNKFYKYENKKAVNNAIYDVTKWLIPSLLIIITISTTWVNCTTYEGKKEVWKAIYNMQKELDTLKSANQTRASEAIIHDSLSLKHS